MASFNYDRFQKQSTDAVQDVKTNLAEINLEKANLEAAKLAKLGLDETDSADDVEVIYALDEEDFDGEYEKNNGEIEGEIGEYDYDEELAFDKLVDQNGEQGQTVELIVAEPAKRLDGFLAESLGDFSRSRLQKLIKDGLVLVNSKPAKVSSPLQIGDEIMVLVPPAQEISVEAENLPLDVIYEDADVIVVNKARGMVVHPAAGNYDGTLVNALLYHCQDLSGINGQLRPGIVHRIDKETSGLIIAAKNDKAHQGLVEQWQTREVERHYLALVYGNMGEPGGTVDAPIARHPKDRKKMAVVPIKGRRAVTHYTVLERLQKYTLIDAKLDTGRTHQIRVHMAYIHHPVVGDIIYGPRGKAVPKVGQLLHSAKMTFRQPLTGEIITCEAPPPSDFLEFIAKAKKANLGI